MNDFSHIVIAMSGGVDSSVAAARLVQAGYRVTGMMLRLWSEPSAEASNRCCTPDAMAQARRVAARLGIPFYAIDVRERFHGEVVQYFIDENARGVTPNPCLICNRHIRWGALLEHAQAFGADAMATGHYARLRKEPDGTVALLKGVDDHKDQSYVLSGLNQTQLSRTLFPLGEFPKPAVREMARELGLTVADRADSQDLCFLGDGDMRRFLANQAPNTARPGPMVDRQGRPVGEHAGLAYYTIGQRKGLGVAYAEPLYVLEKRPADNTLVVGTAAELGSSTLTAGRANWISGRTPDGPFRAQVKIRYKAAPAWGTVNPLADGRFEVQFEAPLRDITPGQVAAVYQGEVCLGSGIIQIEQKERPTT